MTYKIHFKHHDGTEYYFMVFGETAEEIRKKADKGLAKRNYTQGCEWYEKIDCFTR